MDDGYSSQMNSGDPNLMPHQEEQQGFLQHEQQQQQQQQQQQHDMYDQQQPEPLVVNQDNFQMEQTSMPMLQQQ